MASSISKLARSIVTANQAAEESASSVDWAEDIAEAIQAYLVSLGLIDEDSATEASAKDIEDIDPSGGPR